MKIHDLPIRRFIRASVRPAALAWKRQRPVASPVVPSVQANVSLNPTSANADKEKQWDASTRAMHEAKSAFMKSLAPGQWSLAVATCLDRQWYEKHTADFNLACEDAYQLLLNERTRFKFLQGVKPLSTPLRETAAHARELPAIRPARAALQLPQRKQATGGMRPLRLVCPIDARKPVSIAPVGEDTQDTGGEDADMDKTEKYPAITRLRHSKVG